MLGRISRLLRIISGLAGGVDAVSKLGSERFKNSRWATYCNTIYVLLLSEYVFQDLCGPVSTIAWHCKMAPQIRTSVRLRLGQVGSRVASDWGCFRIVAKACALFTLDLWIAAAVGPARTSPRLSPAVSMNFHSSRKSDQGSKVSDKRLLENKGARLHS